MLVVNKQYGNTLVDRLSFTSHFTSDTFPKPISWLGMEKQNLTQQKDAFTDQNKCTTHNKQKKLRPGLLFSHLLQHPAWKWRGPILISVLHKFVTYLLRHPITDSLDPHGATTR